ncbi:MAG: hypothetical protein II842_04815 [Butyrivibrio sp.]|nr:hypothetical protein [Butyrivibrio sp.]
MIDLFEAVVNSADAIGSKYRDICQCRDDLLGFLDRNDWFGIETEWRDGHVFINEYSDIEPKIALWLKAYQRTDGERLEILLDTYHDDYPFTCERFAAFAKEHDIIDKPSGWKILDFIISHSDKDISSLTEQELDSLFSVTAESLPIVSTRLMMEFFNECLQDGKYGYVVHKRKVKESSNTAYSFRDYSTMAYLVFNEKSWETNGLVKKALESCKYADHWLYIAVHFLGALRSTDIVRLPIPEPVYEKDVAKELLMSGTYPNSAAVQVAEDFQLRLKLMPYKPSKTERFSGVPDIKLFIPESLKVAMGIMLSIKLVHLNEGEPLINAVQDLITARKFFGEDFARAAGNRRFATRKANKAYLQGIELTAENEPGKPKGYMLAALARSHKGGIGTLPEITDLYLKDAAFSGYSPEFILMEMFERGILGFIPAMMLEKYSGEAYRKLTVTQQTELIRILGMEAYQLEGISFTVRRAMTRAQEIVLGMTMEEIPVVLQKLASGYAPGKQDEMLCVRTAAGFGCCDPCRSSCVGCGYEVYTKAAFHLLIKEFVRISKKRDSATGSERDRYKMILEKGLMPVIVEIIESFPVLYPDADMGMILDLMERGIRNAENDNN